MLTLAEEGCAVATRELRAPSSAASGRSAKLANSEPTLGLTAEGMSAPGNSTRNAHARAHVARLAMAEQSLMLLERDVEDALQRQCAAA